MGGGVKEGWGLWGRLGRGVPEICEARICLEMPGAYLLESIPIR